MKRSSLGMAAAKEKVSITMRYLKKKNYYIYKFNIYKIHFLCGELLIYFLCGGLSMMT